MALMDWATHVLQWYIQKAAIMKVRANLKSIPCSDCRLKFAYMKLESQVIVYQHDTVN